jgi:glycosyltransferase involved in cell wall biosynthesis
MAAVINITHVITDLQMGGAERMLARLVCSSDPQHFRHQVIVLSGGGVFHEQIQAAGIPVHDLGMRRGRPTPLSLIRALWLIRRSKAHVVQTWLYHGDLLGTLAARLAGCRTICWNIRCSDMDLSRYGRLTRWVVRALAAMSGIPRLILSNSQAGMDCHQALGYHPPRWAIIPNGIEMDRYCPDPQARQEWRDALGLRPENVVFLMAARRDPMKDHDSFLRAARQTALDNPHAAFIAVGRGVDEDADLRKLASQVPAPVLLLGQTHPIERLMAAADVGVLASHFGEGFPNVVAESMSCGLPCIVSNVGDSAQLVQGSGLVFAPGDVTALSKAMSHLARNDSVRHALSQAARQRIEQDYQLSAIVARYQSIWTDLAMGA